MTSPSGLTADIRARVQYRMGPCPACGKPMLGLRRAAALIGIEPSTLSRFLTGSGVESSTLDAIAAWLDRT